MKPQAGQLWISKNKWKGGNIVVVDAIVEYSIRDNDVIYFYYLSTNQLQKHFLVSFINVFDYLQ